MCPTTLGRIETRTITLIPRHPRRRSSRRRRDNLGWIVTIGIFLMMGVALDTSSTPPDPLAAPVADVHARVEEFILLFILVKMLKPGSPVRRSRPVLGRRRLAAHPPLLGVVDARQLDEDSRAPVRLARLDRERGRVPRDGVVDPRRLRAAPSSCARGARTRVDRNRALAVAGTPCSRGQEDVAFPGAQAPHRPVGDYGSDAHRGQRCARGVCALRLRRQSVGYLTAAAILVAPLAVTACLVAGRLRERDVPNRAAT